MLESVSSLRELFEQALAVAAAQRGHWLDEHCPDPEVRAALERMLAADATDDELLTTGDPASAARVIGEADAPEPLPPGSHIGSFELVEVLGEGGSSTVFRAFRIAAGVRQDVAIKLLTRGLYTPEAQRQFRREREALARLKHPGIARLIEGGITEQGLAYIALELVDGVPITRHAREHELAEGRRLELFVQVCRAVEAAHRALIVHRDLKPSNVLVTADGEVKLLDFGIAKLLDSESDDVTRTLHVALTPAYAAPEQFDKGPLTTATDVYALGVLLQELLTGHHCGAEPRTRNTGKVVALRPMRKSGAPKLRGDLATIIGKASAAEPDRRYGSAGALADDIERYLAHEPVLAHPPSRWYRTGKFVARHRGGVLVTVMFLLAILVSWSVALWQAKVAREQAARASMVRDFVESLFAPLRYGTAESRQPSLSQLLADGVAKLDKSPQLGAGERVDLLAMFSRLYENLGDIAQSRKLANRAVTLSERALQAGDINAIRALTARGFVEVRSEDYAAAAVDLRLAHQRLLAQDIHGEALVDLLEPLAAVENIQGHAETALALTREALQERIAAWGPDDPRVGVGYNDVAFALEGLERYDEATLMWQKTYRFELAHFGQYSKETTLAQGGWASAEYRAGHWNHAHDLFAQALAMYARIGGRPEIAQVYAAQKACVLDGLRADRVGAQKNCALAQTLSEAQSGANTPLDGDSLEATAFGEVEQGDLARAKDLFARARGLYGNDPSNRMRIGRVDSELAGIALLEGKPEVARELLPGAIAGLRTRAYKLPPLIAEARLLLACTQSPGPQCPRDLQAKVERHLAAVSHRHDPSLLWVYTLLAQVELHQGQPARARITLERAIQQASGELGPAHPRRLTARLWLAVAMARTGDCANAARQAQAARMVINANHLDSHPELTGALAELNQPIASCGVVLR